MWFSLFVVVLILAITFYQGLLGLFSGAINFVLAVLACALAFGLYEDVFYAYLLEPRPDDGRGIALMGIFIVALLVMRVVFDLLIKDNMHFPIYVDRAGGGVFGFLTAMIIIGTLSTAIQMLPFPYQWLGYSRYAMFNADSGAAVDLTPQEDRQTEAEMLAKIDLGKVNFVRKNIWLNPDGFTVGLVSHLSDNALAGTSSFGRMNATLLDDLHWARFSQMGQSTTSARKADAMRVEACWEMPDDDLMIAEKTKDGKNYDLRQSGSKDKGPAGGNRYLAVRANISGDAADEGATFRFTTQQVRLVTKGSGGRTDSHYLTGISASPEVAKSKDVWYRLAKGESVEQSGGKFDFVFEVPKDADPWYIEFRRNCRAEIKGVDKNAPPSRSAAEGGKKQGKSSRKGNQGSTEGNEDKQASEPGSQSNNNSGRNRRPEINRHRNVDAGEEAKSGGRTKRYSTDAEGSFFSNDLPFPLTNYTKDTIETSSSKVLGGQGRLTANLDANDDPVKGDQAELTTFDVPADKRLLHLSVRRLHPGSTAGQALDFARQLANVSVKDDKGQKHAAIGTWGIATVGRNRVFELVYYDETTQIGSSAPPKLDVIRRDDMTTNYALYYLFPIPPGRRIVSFEVPKGTGEDLTAANLVAPK